MPVRTVRVRVAGPTNLSLSLARLAAVKKRAGKGWTADYTTTLLMSTAAHMLPSYDRIGDGSWSDAVRRAAYDLAM
jgi:hypothetical protein